MTKLIFWFFAVLRAHSIFAGKESLSKHQIGNRDDIKVSGDVDLDSEISTQAYGYEPPTDFNSTVPDLEIRALYDLYYTTDGYYWYWLDYHYYYGNIWNFDVNFIDPCGDHWQGLTCVCSGSGTCHITEIRLSGYELYGYIPDTIQYLSELELLDLSSQYSLYGYIPNSITMLNKLQKLWLYDNALSGTIPYYIGDMSALTDIRMENQFGWFTNGLYSWIPQSITQLKNLTFLSLYYNQLSGELPEDIGELTNLKHLDVSHNILYSSIPESFSDLVSLQYCDLSVNYLWGTLPEAIGNVDQLTTFDIRYNYRMSGTIPDSITQWTQIESLRLSDNLFSGSLPALLGDSLTELMELNLAINRLSGSLPNLKNLAKLSILDILGSGFTGAFGPQIEGLSNLRYLRIASNFFDSGTLPAEMGTLTSLTTLYYNDCELTGTVPEWLYNLTELSELYLENNKLEGTLSESIGKLTKLGLFNINNNKLTGPLPEGFAEAVSLRDIHLEDNQFSGTLPSSLYRTCTANLWCSVYLSNNRLSGPNKLEALCEEAVPNFQTLVAENNQFTGSIPSCIGQLSKTLIFNLVGNRLSGTIPSSIAALTSMQQLALSNNDLSGTLPPLGTMKLMFLFDVSGNRLEGSVEKALNGAQRLSNVFLNDNGFTGLLPEVIFGLGYGVEVALLQNNKFSGKLLNNDTSVGGSGRRLTAYSGKDMKLRTVDLSNNRLTGDIPVELFNAPFLQTLSLSRNCIDGTFPAEMCLSTSLVTIIMNGINSNCETYGAQPLTRSNELPSCVLSMSKLHTLHLTGNRIVGSLSESEMELTHLTDLSLSHNILRGTIPDTMQRQGWAHFDLSYNKITGRLIEDFALNDTKHTTVELLVNRLSGPVPFTFREAENIAILSGSLFGCEYSGDSLPKHDGDLSNFSCGTNTLNILLYLWIGFCFVYLVVSKVHNFFQERPAAKIVWLLLQKLQKMNHVLTFCIVFVLLPVYVACSFYYNTYYDTYAWAVSGSFMAGRTPTIIIGSFWLAFLVVYYVRIHCISGTSSSTTFAVQGFVDNGAEKKPWNVLGTLGKYSKLTVLLICNVVFTVGFNGLYVYIELTYSNAVNVIAQIAMALFKLVWNNYVLRTALQHVFVAPEYDESKTEEENVHLEDQLHMRSIVFETVLNVFNNIVAPCIATMAVNVDCFYNLIVSPDEVQDSYVFDKCTFYDPTTKECTIRVTETISTSFQPTFSYSYQCSSALVTSYSAVFVYMYIVSTFISPIIFDKYMQLQRYRKRRAAEASEAKIKAERKQLRKKAVKELAEPTDAEEPEEPEDPGEAVNVVEQDTEEKTVAATTEISVLGVDTIDGSSKKESKSNSFGLGSRLKSLTKTVSKSLSSKASSKTSFKTRLTRFDFVKSRFVIETVSSMGILLTFGVLFPPLAVIIWYSNKCGFEDIVAHMGAFDEVMKFSDEDDMMDQLHAKLSKVSHMMRYLLLILFPFVSLFYAFFLFDMTGDTEGAKLAAIPAVIMAVLPSLCVAIAFCVRKSCVKKPVKHVVDFSAQNESGNFQQDNNSDLEDEEENGLVILRDNSNNNCNDNAANSNSQRDSDGGDIEMNATGANTPVMSSQQSPKGPQTPRLQSSSRAYSNKSNNSTSNNATGTPTGLQRQKSKKKEKKVGAEEVTGDIGQSILSIFLR